MPWATAQKAATGSLTVSEPDRVHVFIRRATWELVTPDTRLSADELRHGAELGIEGRDSIRDSGPG